MNHIDFHKKRLQKTYNFFYSILQAYNKEATKFNYSMKSGFDVNGKEHKFRVASFWLPRNPSHWLKNRLEIIGISLRDDLSLLVRYHYSHSKKYEDTEVVIPSLNRPFCYNLRQHFNELYEKWLKDNNFFRTYEEFSAHKKQLTNTEYKEYIEAKEKYFKLKGKFE